MYRIFCESYENFIKMYNEENYRLNVAKPFELIVNMEKYEKEKEMQSDLYKKLCDLLMYVVNLLTAIIYFGAICKFVKLL